jgi:hypothetical protein
MKTLRLMLAGAAILSSSLALAQATTSPEPAAAPTAASAAPAKPAKKLSYTDDYRINVNHDAGSDGEIVFTLTPKDGAAQEVRVPIKKGTSENNVAQEIKKAFVAQVGTHGYSIEMEDGENVIIEASKLNKNYSLVLASSTVKGVKVSIHHD